MGEYVYLHFLFMAKKLDNMNKVDKWEIPISLTSVAQKGWILTHEPVFPGLFSFKNWPILHVVL